MKPTGGDGPSQNGGRQKARAQSHPGIFFASEKIGREFFPSVMEHPKRKGGRPAHYPSVTDRRLVEVLTAEGLSQREICPILAVSPKTLRLHYREELDRGSARLEAALAMHLYRLAGGKSVIALRAAIFILKARFGWSPYLPPPR
ncbi:RNA polymerase subunit sigma-70 [Rhizobium beringeri]|uniref:RNA polymerase subunit sigma-70 n=1 Tax=Rhizobium beringeri TaxID=3019934 RepID=UPI002E123576|nr:RNA polymerase subunit sigma-70 [Rhizobium beringeri]